MNIRFVTIEREYGSGGTEIAERVAEECGISCYGREILERAAAKLHISVEEAQQYEENASNSFLYSMFVMSQAQNGSTDMLPMDGKLYVEEHSAISSLARQGKAVFVGHCASEALNGEAGVLRVFIRADEEFKKRRAVEIYGIPEQDADKVCRRYNKKRANYYAVNTTKKWEDPVNYDMILDSSRLGIEGCVKAIAALLKNESNYR